MNNDYLDVNASPSSYRSGTRRLSNRPLLIIGSIIFVVFITIVFALQSRSGKANASFAQEISSLSSTSDSANNFLEDIDFNRLEPPSAGPSVEARVSQPVVNNGQVELPPLLEVEPMISNEELARIARGREYRENLFFDGVVSNTGIILSDEITGKKENMIAGGANPEDPMTSYLRQSLAQQQNGGAQQQVAGITNALAQAGFGGFGAGNADPNMLDQKDAFRATERRFAYSSEFRKPQLTPYELRVGTIIPAVMIGGINSDLPGDIVAQISQNVRDTRDGRHVLIPQGSRLIGTYNSRNAMGDTRVMVAWNRVQFPDGSTLEIGNMTGTDQAGYSGFNDKVNNHYVKIFGNAALLSLIGAGIQMSAPESEEAGDNAAILRQELAREWGRVGTEITSQNLNIQPTIEIRPGYQFNVFVNKDLILDPYEPMLAKSEK